VAVASVFVPAERGHIFLRASASVQAPNAAVGVRGSITSVINRKPPSPVSHKVRESE